MAEFFSVANSDNGWTNDKVYFEWFWDVFIPGACVHAKQHSLSGRHMMLLFDGHGSHVSDDMIRLAFKEKILLFRLPPKTTHKMQPLDVGIFGPFKLHGASNPSNVQLKGILLPVSPSLMSISRSGIRVFILMLCPAYGVHLVNGPFI